MSGISIKFLQELLDSRILIVPNTYIESWVDYYFYPPESFVYELQNLTKNLKLLLLRFHELCGKYHLSTNNMVAFFHEIEMKYKKLCENDVSYAEIKTLLQMVFTDCDFLFGSSYISQNFSVNSLRAADLHVIADKCSNSLFFTFI